MGKRNLYISAQVIISMHMRYRIDSLINIDKFYKTHIFEILLHYKFDSLYLPKFFEKALQFRFYASFFSQIAYVECLTGWINTHIFSFFKSEEFFAPLENILGNIIRIVLLKVNCFVVGIENPNIVAHELFIVE